ncbi:MAG: hypothetical protein AB8G99_14750 [Planctomycetaceae bacterium]
MSIVMTHKDWLKRTNAGALSRRSKKLKAVDGALLQYEQAQNEQGLAELQRTLTAWMQSKGNTWQSSSRNKHNAVETLLRQVVDMAAADPNITEDEEAASERLMGESAEVMQQLFCGAELVWKKGFSTKLGNQKWGTRGNTAAAASNLRVLTNGAIGGANESAAAGTSDGRAMQVAQKLIDGIVPGSAKREVLQLVDLIVPQFARELTASLVPFVGLLTAGGSAVWGGINVVRRQYQLNRMKMHGERVLSVGEPAKAIQAIVRICERERNYEAFGASVALTEFSAKLVAFAVDGGAASTAAIGLGANVLKLTNILRVTTRDVLERRAANKLMALDSIDVSVFEECPIVGCYLVCCAPTSVLVNQILTRFGDHGWMDEVERNVTKHVTPLRTHARQLITQSRFEIPTLRSYAGLVEVNEDELERMRNSMGKTAIGQDNLSSAGA